jgi:hypothetical protein
MTGFKMKTLSRKIILLFLLTTALVACGGGGGGGDGGSGGSGGDEGIGDDNFVYQPPAPRDMTIEHDVDGNIILDWDATGWNDYISYKVYWSTSGYLDLQQKRASFSVLKPPFVHKNLSFGTTYYYAITRIQNTVESDLSTSRVAAIAGAPSKPVNASAESVYSDINVSWDSVPRADTYTVYWSNGLGESETIEFATSPFLHTGLVGVEYEYAVTASNEYGESMIVDVAASPDLAPETPIGLSVARTTWLIELAVCTGHLCGTWMDHSYLGDKYGAQINVSWQGIGTNYWVYRVGYNSESTRNSSYVKRYRSNWLTDSYCYYVVAWNRFGSSLPTDTVCDH